MDWDLVWDQCVHEDLGIALEFNYDHYIKSDYIFIPREEYLAHFKQRDLITFSVEPLLLYPTHYTGEPGYSSDTETSTIWDNESINTDWDRQRSHKKPNRGDAAPLPTSDGRNRDEL